MGAELEFLAAVAADRAEGVLRGLPRSAGHGDSLTRAIRVTAEQLKSRASTIVTGGPYLPALERVHARDLQRLASEANVLHQLLSAYAGDVGRTDVPVGLLYLIDELIRDLLPSGADPILHLDSSNMYSTFPVFERAPHILNPAAHPEPHPVVFNVPGLEPANALLSPILAHEVGHTCWRRTVGRDLRARLDLVAIQAALQIGVSAGANPKELGTLFDSWLVELMCDGLAATLTGPAFLFASTVFLPAAGEAGIGSHPYPLDRLAFTLQILDRYGWTSVLGGLVPTTFDWCVQSAANPHLAGDPRETALRAAMAIAQPAMIELAEEIAVNRLRAEDFERHKNDLFSYLDLGIPPSAPSGDDFTAWLLVASSWLHEIRIRGDGGPANLPAIASDPTLNRFLLKSVELSGIARLWRTHGTSAP